MRRQNDRGEWVTAKPVGGKVRHWKWAQRIVDWLWK